MDNDYVADVDAADLTDEIRQSSLVVAQKMRRPSWAFRKYRRYGEGFKKRLAKTWSEPFTLYQIILRGAFDALVEFSQQHWDEAIAENDFAFESLTSLQARACLVAGEVLELLKGGYPHGAQARCRTLHEIAVFAWIIGKHPEVAERFLLHEAVEDSDNMDTYQAKLAGRPGYDPISQADIDENHARKDAVLKRYGKAFKGRYGWAAELFPPKEPPTFGKLEELAGLDHLRPFYDWATHLGVHASSRGARLNVIRRGDEATSLAGPTNAFLSHPGQSAIVSLVQVTTTLLVYGRPIGVDTQPLVIAMTLLKLSQDANEAFDAAEKRLAEKEARAQAEAAKKKKPG